MHCFPVLTCATQVARRVDYKTDKRPRRGAAGAQGIFGKARGGHHHLRRHRPTRRRHLFRGERRRDGGGLLQEGKLHDGGIRSVRSPLRRSPLLATPIATPLQCGRPKRPGLLFNFSLGEVEGREATKRLTKTIELRALEYGAHAAGRVISAARREFGGVPTWSAVKSKEFFHQNIRRFGQSPPLSSSANIPRGSHTSISESNRDRLCESHTR